MFEHGPAWDSFYADRSRQIPFFVPKPDENLVSYLDQGLVSGGRAMDLGCGAGRNAVYLAGRGFDVTAVDLSVTAIEWARERAAAAGVEVDFHRGDAFTLELAGQYDLIYDSGCFHHLPPHRRISYLALADRLLRPGGHLGLACFAAGEMGSELPDEDLYRTGSLGGGLAYTAAALRHIFADYKEKELRRMHDEPADSAYFGEPFLWTALFQCPRTTGR
jgi:SAM-dependent methyltransferase